MREAHPGITGDHAHTEDSSTSFERVPAKAVQLPDLRLPRRPALRAASAVLRPAEAVIHGPMDWPLPDGPWWREAAGNGVSLAGQLQLDRRRFVNGRLQALDLSRASVQWLAAGDSDATELPFAAFRCLRLMALVPAEPTDALGVRPLPAALPFRIEFADGDVWNGLSYRVADPVLGFFVCEPIDEAGNLRLAFVPRSAWRSLRIGAQPVPGDAALGGAAGDATPWATSGRAASPRLGQVLIELGLIDPQQLQRALTAQRANRCEPLGELLIRQGWLSREGLARALAVKAGQPVEAS